MGVGEREGGGSFGGACSTLEEEKAGCTEGYSSWPSALCFELGGDVDENKRFSDEAVVKEDEEALEWAEGSD